MKRLIYIVTVLFLMITSCVKDTNVIPTVEEVNLSFVLSDYLGEMSSEQAKPAGVRTKGGVFDENAITSLMLLQFRHSVGDGTSSLVSKTFVSESELKVPSGVDVPGNFATIVELSSGAGEEISLYLIANVPVDAFTGLTIGTSMVADFESLLILHDATKVPWLGVLKGEIVSVSGGKIFMRGTPVVEETITLQPLAAKIIFNYSVHVDLREGASGEKNSFKVISVQIKDAPSKFKTVFDAEPIDWNSQSLKNYQNLDVSVNSNVELTAQDITAPTSATDGIYTFYMPERIGGIPVGLTNESKKTEAFLKLGVLGRIIVDDDDFSDILSYVELKGIYTQNVGSADPLVYDVTFPIFLGSVKWINGGDPDPINGYNVRAGYEYRINLLNIDNGIASDPRVKLTLNNPVSPAAAPTQQIP